jgi:hypothetical protein
MREYICWVDKRGLCFSFWLWNSNSQSMVTSQDNVWLSVKRKGTDITVGWNDCRKLLWKRQTCAEKDLHGKERENVELEKRAKLKVRIHIVHFPSAPTTPSGPISVHLKLQQTPHICVRNQIASNLWIHFLPFLGFTTFCSNLAGICLAGYSVLGCPHFSPSILQIT